LKLALVTETFPPEVNGVSMTLGRLCEGLLGLGWSLQVVRPAQEHEEARRQLSGGAFEELLLAGIPIPGYSSLRMGEPGVFRLWSDWSAKRPDLVHIATEGPLGLAALAVAKLLGIPVSSTYHTNFQQYSSHYGAGFVERLLASYLRWIHNACSCTLAPTREMADALASEGYQRAGVLSRGVDTELFDPARRDSALRARWGLTAESVAVLYVGRIAREKNIDLVASAYQAAWADRDARLVLVGDGPEREQLQEKYPEFIFAGLQVGEALATHYASADVFLFASVTETFGNVVTEAMASGLAVCAYDYAAGREFVRPGQSGELARMHDREDFLAKARALASLSRGELKLRGDAARRVAEGIAWKSIVESFAGSLESARCGSCS